MEIFQESLRLSPVTVSKPIWSVRISISLKAVNRVTAMMKRLPPTVISRLHLHPTGLKRRTLIQTHRPDHRDQRNRSRQVADVIDDARPCHAHCRKHNVLYWHRMNACVCRVQPKMPNGRITKPGDMIIYVAGYPAIYGVQPLYFQDEVFAARAKVDPPLSSDRLTAVLMMGWFWHWYRHWCWNFRDCDHEQADQNSGYCCADTQHRSVCAEHPVRIGGFISTPHRVCRWFVPLSMNRFQKAHMLRSVRRKAMCLIGLYARGYINPGNCPGGYGQLLKRVHAVAGDAVLIDETGITVNGQLLPNSIPITHRCLWRRIAAIPVSMRYSVNPNTCCYPIWIPTHLMHASLASSTAHRLCMLCVLFYLQSSKGGVIAMNNPADDDTKWYTWIPETLDGTAIQISLIPLKPA